MRSARMRATRRGAFAAAYVVSLTIRLGGSSRAEPSKGPGRSPGEGAGGGAPCYHVATGRAAEPRARRNFFSISVTSVTSTLMNSFGPSYWRVARRFIRVFGPPVWKYGSRHPRAFGTGGLLGPRYRRSRNRRFVRGRRIRRLW